MTKSGRRNTRQDILQTVHDLVRAGGPGLVTFDGVAGRLGISKQAVIYWFPTKDDLIAGAALPALREEADCAIAAVADAPDAASAVERFVRSIAAFHLADLDRFRLIYIAPQSGAKTARRPVPPTVSEKIHPVTSAMYDALEAKLAAAPNGPDAESRRAALTVHMAVLGLVLMVALADAVNDPLRHDTAALIDSLVAVLASGYRSAG